MTHGAVRCSDAELPLFIERVHNWEKERERERERVQMEGDDVIYYYYETGWKMVYFIQLHLLALSLSLQSSNTEIVYD